MILIRSLSRRISDAISCTVLSGRLYSYTFPAFGVFFPSCFLFNSIKLSSVEPCQIQKYRNTTFIRPEFRRIKGRLGSEKWMPESEFDLLVYWDRRFRRVMQLKTIIELQEECVLSLWEIKKSIKIDIKYRDRRQFKDRVLRYPGIFRIFKDKDREPWVEFTEAAEKLILEEKKIKSAQAEEYAVEMIRKLLMMTQNKRLGLEKLNLCKRDFLLPSCSTLRLLKRYPQYFKIIDKSGFPAVELTDWDPLLAVTTREKWVMQTPKAGKYEFPISQPKRFNPGHRMLRAIQEFQKLSFPSPYEDICDMDLLSPEAQKRSVAICHEYLSMTLEKMTVVNKLAYFTPEFQLPKNLDLFLHKYPGIFYVSHKGDQFRHVVFLKEAYDGPFLLNKHPLVVIKDRFLELMQIKPDKTIDGEPEKLSNCNILTEECGEEDDYQDEDKEYSDFSFGKLMEQRELVKEFIEEL